MMRSEWFGRWLAPGNLERTKRMRRDIGKERENTERKVPKRETQILRKKQDTSANIWLPQGLKHSRQPSKSHGPGASDTGMKQGWYSQSLVWNHSIHTYIPHIPFQLKQVDVPPLTACMHTHTRTHVHTYMSFEQFLPFSLLHGRSQKQCSLQKQHLICRCSFSQKCQSLISVLNKPT